MSVSIMGKARRVQVVTLSENKIASELMYAFSTLPIPCFGFLFFFSFYSIVFIVIELSLEYDGEARFWESDEWWGMILGVMNDPERRRGWWMVFVMRVIGWREVEGFCHDDSGSRMIDWSWEWMNLEWMIGEPERLIDGDFI